MATLDTVKSFSAYAKIGLTKVYELTRIRGFPVIRTSKRGKILIKREDALSWTEKHCRA
jgi:hypothetical protein